MQRDPPGVASHDLHDHHALVALGRGMDLVDRFSGRLDCGVESERELGPADVVIDRLGNAYHRNPLLAEQPLRDAERAVAADRDEGVDAFFVERGNQLVGPIVLAGRAVGALSLPAERVAAVGRAEDGAAQVGNAADGVRVERHDAVLVQQPVVAAPDADAFPAAVERGEHGPADHGVQPRGVAAAGGDGDSQRAGGAIFSIRRSTSPGSAWRPSDFLENTRRPSTSTSNTPPDDWISLTSACGWALRISAARPAARGS